MHIVSQVLITLLAYHNHKQEGHEPDSTYSLFFQCFCIKCLYFMSILQGHCFVAIDPNAFEEGFTDRMSELMSFCRNLDPVSIQEFNTYHFYSVIIPSQKVVLGAHTVFSLSVIPSFHDHFKVLPCNFSRSCPILSNFSPHLNHQTLYVV